ncbi:MAG: UDP-glucose 4-epimerase GalE [Acidobacteriota bacterium]
MNVLVTGGAGYIGSVVVEHLTERGHRAVAFDNLSRGHREAVAPGASLVVGDLRDGDALVAAIREHEIEAVIHMAASSLVGESVIDPHAYFNNNVVGGISLLDAMLTTGVRRLVFSSTCAVYGEPATVPITEDLPLQPVNAYGETKLIFERTLKWYEAAYGLRYISLRYFNAAGATERCGEDHSPETHIIPIVLDVARGRRSHVDILGEDYATPDGTCIRDYIHVSDLAEAHLVSLLALEKGSRIFNLGYGAGYSVQEVVEMARQVTGRQILTEGAPRRPGDPPILIASADRAMSELGWQPRHSELDVIIQSAWRWHEEHPEGYGPA